MSAWLATTLTAIWCSTTFGQIALEQGREVAGTGIDRGGLNDRLVQQGLGSGMFQERGHGDPPSEKSEG